MEWVVVGLIIAVTVLVLMLFKEIKGKAVGICDYTLEQSVHKQKNKQKILELFENNSELTNERVKEALKVTDRSVVRYMDELGHEGKVAQIGTTGRGVVYRIIGR